MPRVDAVGKTEAMLGVAGQRDAENLCYPPLAGAVTCHVPDSVPRIVSITKSVLSIVSFMMDKTWLY
jgi:hypothetical protein